MRRVILVSQCVALLLASSRLALSQAKDMTFEERTQLNSALDRISNDVVKHYDPKLHGVDWDFKVKQTQDKIKDEKSLTERRINNTIAESLTYFLASDPPWL